MFKFTSTVKGQVVEIKLSDGECADMKASVDEIVEKHGHHKIDGAHELIARVAAEHFRSLLTTGNLMAIQDYCENVDVVALHISNTPSIPAARLPDTPYQGHCPDCEKAVIASDIKQLGLLKLAMLCGVATPAENGGRLFRNVVAIEGKELTVSSHGSENFGKHMDNPTGELSKSKSPVKQIPFALAFDPQRNLEQVSTSIEPTANVLDQMPVKLVRILEEPAFTIGPPQSNNRSHYAPVLEAVPLLVCDEDGTKVLRYDPTSVSSARTNPVYAEALKELAELLNNIKPTYKINLQPGDWMMFKNRSILHSREAFSPHEPRKLSRWLRRIYASYSRED